MRYIKVFFQKIVARESSDYWYAYSNTPAYQCNVKLGKVTSSFNVTVRNQQSSKPVEQVTLWLSDITDDEAQDYRDTIGSTAYLQVDTNNDMTLLSITEFQNLDAKEQKNLVLQLSA